MDDEEANKNDDEELDKAIKELPPNESKAIGRLARMFKAKDNTRKGNGFVKTLTIMAKATRLSVDANKYFWDFKNDSTLANYKPENLEKAAAMCKKSITLLNQALADFPTTVSAVVPMKQKIEEQLDMITKMQGGAIAKADIIKGESNGT